MRVVSGIQPTGKPHLGNYLGAIRNYVKLQDDALAAGGECFIFIADLHAISMPHDPVELRQSTLELVATLVACGLDTNKTVLFNQAQVPAHSELQWLLSGTARMGWLNRMTQFKDKSGKNREGASIALFTYPVLQAADVLLYQATHVPVGEDQKQHLELARDIAQKFNNDFASEDDAGVHPARTLYPARGGADHEPARRDREDEQVGPIRHEPHQPVRRCRHDHEEDQEGQDRPRALAVRGGGAGRPARGEESGRDLRRNGRQVGR